MPRKYMIMKAEQAKGSKEGLAATGLTREELFVTSKVWNNYLTYDETIVAF